MSVVKKDKDGNFITLAGTLVKRENAKWFLCQRSEEDGIEYYTIPLEAEEYYKDIESNTVFNLGFNEPNTTSNPKIRYKDKVLELYDVSSEDHLIQVGFLNGVYQAFTKKMSSNLRMYIFSTTRQGPAGKDGPAVYFGIGGEEFITFESPINIKEKDLIVIKALSSSSSIYSLGAVYEAKVDLTETTIIRPSFSEATFKIDVRGPKGKDGKDGEDGVPGVQGPAGKDGVSISIMSGIYFDSENPPPDDVLDNELPIPNFEETEEGHAYVVDDSEISGQYDLWMHNVGATTWTIIDNWGGVPGPKGKDALVWEGPQVSLGSPPVNGDTVSTFMFSLFNRRPELNEYFWAPYRDTSTKKGYYIRFKVIELLSNKATCMISSASSTAIQLTGQQGEQGFSFVANINRGNSYTEAELNIYGSTNYEHEWTNTETLRNDCRVNDLFTITATANDSGNAHILIYKSTTSSGDLKGICIGHTYALRGEPGISIDVSDLENLPFLPLLGGTVTGNVTVTGYLAPLEMRSIGSFGVGVQSKIIQLPYISENYLGISGHDQTTFLKAWLKKICELRPGYANTVFVGVTVPNSAGPTIVEIYNTSDVDSTTGLPRYCSGMFTSINGAIVVFGTSNYDYFSHNCYTTGNKPTASEVGALSTSGGTVNGETTFQGGQLHLKTGSATGLQTGYSALPYVLGIKPFGDGGDVMYRDWGTFKNDLGINRYKHVITFGSSSDRISFSIELRINNKFTNYQDFLRYLYNSSAVNSHKGNDGLYISVIGEDSTGNYAKPIIAVRILPDGEDEYMMFVIVLEESGVNTVYLSGQNFTDSVHIVQ